MDGPCPEDGSSGRMSSPSPLLGAGCILVVVGQEKIPASGTTESFGANAVGMNSVVTKTHTTDDHQSRELSVSSTGTSPPRTPRTWNDYVSSAGAMSQAKATRSSAPLTLYPIESLQPDP